MQQTKQLFEEYPEILDAKAISVMLGIGYSKALTTIRYGGMPYIKIGNTYRVPKQSFINWLFATDKREIDVIY